MVAAWLTKLSEFMAIRTPDGLSYGIGSTLANSFRFAYPILALLDALVVIPALLIPRIVHSTTLLTSSTLFLGLIFIYPWGNSLDFIRNVSIV